MAGYVNYGDDKTYLFNFRMTRVQLEHASDKIAEVGFLNDSIRNPVAQVISKATYFGRFLLKDISTNNEIAVKMIDASMVLHNYVSLFHTIDDEGSYIHRPAGRGHTHSSPCWARAYTLLHSFQVAALLCPLNKRTSSLGREHAVSENENIHALTHCFIHIRRVLLEHSVLQEISEIHQRQSRCCRMKYS
jgi:hypothetical protein